MINMNGLVNKLIEKISPESISSFFATKISSFRQVKENYDHLVEGSGDSGFSQLSKLGEVEYSNSDELLIFSCKYKGTLSERSSKKKQFEIAKKVLTKEFKDGAIFVFYDETGKFRFSFIRKNYGEKDKKFSSWKRYTYFVDPELTNKTFIIRLDNCKFSSLDEIIDAFSVEPLNKEFYDKIVRAFYSLVGGDVGTGRNTETLTSNLSLPGGQTNRTIIRQFGVRLIGRIIFCWFLKHKSSKSGIPLIPENWLSSKSVDENYYHSTLELLFFEVLNRKLDLRPKHLHENHHLIPFLNGGLFEPLTGIDCDYYEPQKMTELQRANYQLKITDNWFKSLFETLEQYNFTIDENSVNDSEVSIDPEMLGRIFENLLAEIDPNLDSSAQKSVRKATGSYYTPREIVDYMVEEALVKYLFNKTYLCEKTLHQLFGDNEELSFTEEEKDNIISALDQVKILDPAAGSGAFPMGALHKIVIALQKLDPGAEKWKSKQLDKITNAAVKAEMKTIFEKSNAEYSRKLGVLQQCIYGADIQPIAAEISRLRSFLSLIVDEEIYDNRQNRGILPLPNLEFKFVTANTLINLDSSGKIETAKVSELIPSLQKIRQDYLQAHGNEKESLRNKFRELQQIIYLDQIRYNPDPKCRPMQLAEWDPFINKIVDWFDPEWMFGVKQFDVVIGNPPYGGTDIPEDLKKTLGLGSKDPYGAFIAKYLQKQWQPTCLKHEGILAYIVSDTFMTIKSHQQLRGLILDNRIHSMMRMHPDTFNATVNTAVLICERLENSKEDEHKVLMADFTNTSIHDEHDSFLKLLDLTTDYKQPDFIGNSFERNQILYTKGSDWTSESSENYAIYTYAQNKINELKNIPNYVSSSDFTKIFRSKIKLGDLGIAVQGIGTGDNSYYLRKEIDSKGNYQIINPFEILTNEEIINLTDEEKVNGILNKKYSERKYVEYDKGGSSDSFNGWLPQYHVRTGYYINWSAESVYRLFSATIADCKTRRGHEEGSNEIVSEKDRQTRAAWLPEPENWFKKGVTFSRTGMYAPTFRIKCPGPFDNKSDAIITEDPNLILGIANSKIAKFLIKNYLCHTVQTEKHDVSALPLPLDIHKYSDKIKFLVKQTIEIQCCNYSYDYASNEQLEIDYLIYKAYGLNWADIREVENWYARRYPKLVTAQKKNLQNTGKPQDYIEIYKSFIEKYGDVEKVSSSNGK